MQPFWGPGAITLDDVTGELTHRGWVTRDDAGRYALTPAGRAAHAAVQEKAREIRFTVLAGLTEDDYSQTVGTLKQMAGNLERAAGHQASAG
jgi:Mn-dependent DtxR family transcriptional regulator